MKLHLTFSTVAHKKSQKAPLKTRHPEEWGWRFQERGKDTLSEVATEQEETPSLVSMEFESDAEKPEEGLTKNY